MLDKIKLLEMLKDLAEIAATQGNTLTKEEIKAYFEETPLPEGNMTPVYTYLAENHVNITDFEPENIPVKKEEEHKEEDCIFLKMYQEDLSALEKVTKEEELVILRETENEIPGAKERLLNIWLPRVVELSKEYKNQGVLLEDLIQEGNIGLLCALEKLPHLKKTADRNEYLTESIQAAMVKAIDESMGEDDLESTLIGRSNLLKEAEKYLAEDMGRVPTIEELSDFTKLSREEIQDVITLSPNALHTGKGVK